MRFGKAVFAEAENLLIDLPREIFCITARRHSVDQPLLEFFEAALASPCGHRAAQVVGFAGRESCRDDRKPHHLFLKNRHAERSLEHTFHRIARISDRLQSLPALEIGMHHAALYRPRPHDRDFDDEIVEGLWLETRQHRLLRARFDLKHAYRVGMLDHLVDVRIFRRNVLHSYFASIALRDHRERAADRGEHAERQTIHLEQSERVEVVLVPLDYRALRHRRVFDRHHSLEQPARDDEAADVLRQMPRKSQQLAGERDEPRDQRIFGIEARFADTPRIDRAAIPPRENAREPIDLREIETERLADVAHGALRTIGDERRGERRAIATVFLVDVLHHLFAALMLEVDVDVRRLVALARNEALEQR